MNASYGFITPRNVPNILAAFVSVHAPLNGTLDQNDSEVFVGHSAQSFKRLPLNKCKDVFSDGGPFSTCFERMKMQQLASQPEDEQNELAIQPLLTVAELICSIFKTGWR